MMPSEPAGTSSGHPLAFGRGADNPIGLRLIFTWDGRTTTAVFHPAAGHQGWPGFVHGGVILALLDEAAGSAALLSGRDCVSARVRVKLKRPARINESLTVAAVIRTIRGRLVVVDADVKTGGGVLIAGGEIVLMMTGPEYLKNIEGVKTCFMEKSLVLVKPDAVARGLSFAILSRLEKEGLKLIALKMLTPSRALAERHYAVHRGKSFFPALIEYITSGPIIAAVFAGDDAINRIRFLMGATDPVKAAPGTIRREFGLDIEKNAIHGSDSPDTAAVEIPLYFAGLEMTGEASPTA